MLFWIILRGRILPGPNFKAANSAAFLFARSASVPRNIRRNSPRLILAEQLGRRPSPRLILEIGLCEPPNSETVC
jgi:hypothetical protein